MWFKKIVDKFRNKKKKQVLPEEINVNKLCFWFVVVYIAIYLFFLFVPAFLPAGEGLAKRDWLSFLGSYLSFSGTLFVCYITLLQNKIFVQRSEDQKKEDRFIQIQPIFSLEVKTQNIARFDSVENLKKYEELKLKQFFFTLRNFGAFPALHIRIFDEYIVPSLSPDETFEFTCVYNLQSMGCKISGYDIMLNLPVGSSGETPPQNVVVEYYDVDGNAMAQKFVWSNYRNKELYVLLQKEKM